MGSSSKKTSHDATRADRKVKKRRLEDAVPDLPGDNVVAGDIVIEGEEGKSKKRKRENEMEKGVSAEDGGKMAKKEKKDKKRKLENGDAEGVEVEKKDSKKDKKGKKNRDKSAIEDGSADAEATVQPTAYLAGVEEVPKKSKKERKAERKAKEAAEKAAKEQAIEGPVAESNGDVETAGTAEEKKFKKNNRNREKKRKTTADGESSKAPRFIVFVGNLPFSATTESVTKHFASVKPKSVRHLTQKDQPSKSKGCAFVEFEGYDHMKTCLKLFHHSSFDDGVSPARKINVELTAGGGGNTKDRRSKIEEKNHKLNDERFRRIQAEETAKHEKKAGGASIDESAIHPSRRRMVPVA